MAPAKKPTPVTNSPAAAKGQAEFVLQVCEQVKSVVQTPEILKIIVDSIIESVTKVVVERLQETLNFNLEEVNDLRDEIARKDSEIQGLEEKLVELEQYQRRDNLRIFGIPEKANEDTDGVALKLFEDKLGIQLRRDDISRSHRIGPKVAGKVRPIIIKFTNYRPRNAVFRSKRKLKGTNITIKEDLCSERLQLLRAATEKFGHRQVFSQDGKIVVIKNDNKHFITSKHELSRL